MAEPIDKNILKQIVPSNALKAENFEELAGKTFVETVHAGKTIFKEGDTDKKSARKINTIINKLIFSKHLSFSSIVCLRY